MSVITEVVVWITGILLAIGAFLTLVRMIIGPTIIDRMVASDTLLTFLICILVAEMIVNEHTSTLPLVLALALTAFIASVAVARYVSRQDSHERLSSETSAANYENTDTAGLRVQSWEHMK